MANAMGEDDVARLLNENLAQEQNALRKIQAIGKRLAAPRRSHHSCIDRITENTKGTQRRDTHRGCVPLARVEASGRNAEARSPADPRQKRGSRTHKGPPFGSCASEVLDCRKTS